VQQILKQAVAVGGNFGVPSWLFRMTLLFTGWGFHLGSTACSSEASGVGVLCGGTPSYAPRAHRQLIIVEVLGKVIKASMYSTACP